MEFLFILVRFYLHNIYVRGQITQNKVYFLSFIQHSVRTPQLSRTGTRKQFLKQSRESWHTYN